MEREHASAGSNSTSRKRTSMAVRARSSSASFGSSCTYMCVSGASVSATERVASALAPLDAASPPSALLLLLLLLLLALSAAPHTRHTVDGTSRTARSESTQPHARAATNRCRPLAGNCEL